MNQKAVVLHSGGIDSSIVLKLAIDELGTDNVTALSYAWGQRHAIELDAAAKICKTWGVTHKVVNVDALPQITNNALTDASIPIQRLPGQPANTLVVGRNGLFVRLGAIYAHQIGAQSVWIGIFERETEHSGYRDCSRTYMDLKEQILRIDLADPHFTIRTPLVKLTKAQSLALADSKGILDFLLEETVTCYEGISKTGCGRCPACLLRGESLCQYRASKGHERGL